MTARCEAEDARDEGGFALFYALLVTLVVAGIVAIVFATAVSENRQSTFELDFEDTVHVAEAGAEAYLQRLALDATANSGIDGPADGSTDAEITAWALDQATAESGGVYMFDAIDMGEGEAVALRPQGDDAEFVYGVGFTPSRDAYDNGIGDAYARVVRVQIAFSPSVVPGDHALLAGGNLTLDGGVDIAGANGSVHTNGGLAVSGTSGSVTGGITYSGTCDMDPCDGTASAPINGPIDTTPIPRIQLTEVWATDDALELAEQGLWFDYCESQWHQREVDDILPCTGPVVPAPVPWNGTAFEGTDGGSPGAKGVFYFRDEIDLSIKRPNGKITIITGGSMTVGPSADEPAVDALYPGLFLLADGDITFSGNFNGIALDEPALVFSNETLKFTGNPDTENIAFIARDTLQAGSTYGGTGTVNYGGGAAPDLGTEGFPLVVQWDEVR